MLCIGKGVQLAAAKVNVGESRKLGWRSDLYCEYAPINIDTNPEPTTSSVA